MEPTYLYIVIIGLLIINHRFYWKVNNRLKFKDHTPFFIAHRGYKNNYPGNTLESYKAAEEIGFKWVELDVVATKDGHIMCTHNFDLERETNGKGFLHELTANAVNPINVVDKNRKPTGIMVPSLHSVFDELDINTMVNIEIKAPKAFDISTARAFNKILTSKIIKHVKNMLNHINIAKIIKHCKTQ